MKPLQHYHSIGGFALHHRLVLPVPRHWWLLQPCITGEINALHRLRGLAVATNGILLAIETQNEVFFGHREWFNEDKDQPALEMREPSNAKRVLVEQAEKTFV